MILEYFAEASEPTVLLHGNVGAEVVLLREALRPLTEEEGRRVAIHELPFVQAIGGCALFAFSGPRVLGVDEWRRPGSFVWTHDPLTWLQTYDLLEPFEQEKEAPSGRFQFISEGRGPRVIFSTTRAW